MPFPSPQPRLQRFIGGCIAALLTAGAFAVVEHLEDDETASHPLRRPPATGDVIVPPDGATPTIAIITTPDGRTLAADPTTTEGRRTIDEARRDGSTLRDLAIPSRGPTTGPNGPTIEPGTDELLGAVLDELPGGVRPDEDDTGGGGLLEIDPKPVEDLLEDPLGSLEDPVGPLTSIVTSTPSTPTTSTTPTTSPSTTVPLDDPVCTLLLPC